MHTHMKKYVNIKYFRNHILIQNSPKHPNLQTLEKKFAKKSTIIERQTFFFFTHSTAKPHDDTPIKNGL